jgi:hypothetical protein
MHGPGAQDDGFRGEDGHSSSSSHPAAMVDMIAKGKESAEK